MNDVSLIVARNDKKIESKPIAEKLLTQSGVCSSHFSFDICNCSASVLQQLLKQYKDQAFAVVLKETLGGGDVEKGVANLTSLVQATMKHKWKDQLNVFLLALSHLHHMADKKEVSNVANPAMLA